MSLCIRIVRPASREKVALLPARIAEFEARGHRVLFEDQPADPSWPFVSSSIATRLADLTRALLEPDSQVIIAARGGYGVSDLVSGLPWDRLKSARQKILVGFSDISVLHSALLTRLGWQRCIHAPMAASELWTSDTASDIQCLWDLLEGRTAGGHFPITPLQPAHADAATPTTTPVEGWLFGGNLSVLTNILGTDYFPKSLAGAIVFLEDVGENPARLIRQFTQWLHLNALDGTRALVLGGFTGLGNGNPDHDPRLLEQFRRRVAPMPVFSTTAFGHLSPNFPIGYGAKAVIKNNQLSWQWSSDAVA